MTKASETQEYLHREILEKMREIGEPSPDSFCQVMEQEPGLLERYLRSCGLEVESAVIDEMSDDRLKVKALMAEESREMRCEVRFIRGVS